MNQISIDIDQLKKKRPVPKNARLQVTISKELIDRFEKVVNDGGFDRSKLMEKALTSLLDVIEKKDKK